MTPQLTRQQLAETAQQARRDLDELESQLASGEIDESTGDRLRSTYREDLAKAEAALSEIIDTSAEPVKRSRSRMLVGAAILVTGMALAIGLVGSFVQDRGDGTLLGVAGEDDFDPEDYSNESLEAVLASIVDDQAALQATLPMRFRLAERYFTEQDYLAAFEHYRYIIEANPTPEIASASLTRVAWIVFAGNGLTDLALQTVDQALEANGANTEALYVKAQILWCGVGDTLAAVPLLEQVLAAPEIEGEVREQVATDLELARSGEGCVDG